MHGRRPRLSQGTTTNHQASFGLNVYYSFFLLVSNGNEAIALFFYGFEADVKTRRSVVLGWGKGSRGMVMANVNTILNLRVGMAVNLGTQLRCHRIWASLIFGLGLVGSDGPSWLRDRLFVHK